MFVRVHTHTLHLFLLSLSYLKDAMQFLLSSVKKVLYTAVYLCGSL